MIVGTSTDAHCFACGYDTFLLIGGGMLDHLKNVAWPIYCKSCNAITTGNHKQEPLTCKACNTMDVVPINDPSVWLGDNEGTCEMWGRLKLVDGHYRCPKCAQFRLRFGKNAGGHGKLSWD